MGCFFVLVQALRNRHFACFLGHVPKTSISPRGRVRPVVGALAVFAAGRRDRAVGLFDRLAALFTSTSAVCVTGLIVVDTAAAFTPLGQGIILLLIQLGAFGIVTLTFFLAIISGQGFSVSSRVFLRDYTGKMPVLRGTGHPACPLSRFTSKFTS